MKRSVVLYPGLGVGHLTPMVELAKVFLHHGAAVTVALVEPPTNSPDFSAAVARAAASNPSVTFHVLPPPPPAPADPSSTDNGGTSSAHHIVLMFDYLKAMCAPLRDFLRSLPAVDALVLDMFCGDALDVAAELNLPVFYFYASGAGDLAIFLNLARMDTSTTFAELGDSLVSFPGAPPFKASDLPKEISAGSPGAKPILGALYRLPEANGILVNTFESLETRAVRALRDGLCVPDRSTPPVYCIGPLVSGGGEKGHECLRWLDTQPENSVVFLSFGSMGTFPKKQLEEIAIGLEKSGQRFLWVVRSPRNPEGMLRPLPEPDLDALLPEGFLGRTKDTGLVLKSWAPQVDVLRHRATGAFVTHCGWNSTLEGITAGLPLLCWPLYAEQRMNKVFIVEEMKLGVEMKGYDEELVKAEEVETKVRWVMESEGGQALRKRVEEVKGRAIEAIGEGGSSHAAFVEFLKDLDNMSLP
ncbi:anthocyanidin 5,3-O-glucosyltransferase-like [Panicum miliaceum]|uniref:Glycosyltransferase n=1 Tax=Panicum miliaceum TaxID=4540 RepID=A0A3L6SH08_PANMI|nr:anthocyanidin 5,3-O-glucosyltransferase-like [Panicum miliaceum]